MSSFKPLSKADITTVSYTANKSWNIPCIFPTSGSYINTYKGQYLTSSFSVTSDPTSSNGQYSRLLYDSINHLFYQQYTESLDTGSIMFNVSTYESASQQRPTSSYFNYNTNPIMVKNFPTGANETINVLSINHDIYGSKVLPNSFILSSSTYYITDDGYGNLYSSSTHVGNIFYAHGISVITNQNHQDIFTSGSASLSFQNEHIVFENEIRCIIKESEYNLSYNPSICIDSSGSLKGFATSASFHPYVTSIGLYNDENELLMIAKLAKPIMISPYTDMTFIVKYDI